MFKKISLCFVVATVMLLFSGAVLMAQDNHSQWKNHQPPKQSPFLITSDLPHLTKVLMQHWDNASLQLSDEQKDRLLVVRKETITAVKALAPQIAPLKQQVVEGIFAGKAPSELSVAVEAIAKLKTQATMIHLKCTYDTKEILSQQQLDLLLGLQSVAARSALS